MIILMTGLKINNMKNVFLLPTESPSRLYHHGISELSFTKKNCIWEEGRHLYITSEEDIEEGDWFIFYSKQLGWPPKVYRHNGLDIHNFIKVYEDMSVDPMDCSRIVLTTDSLLVDDVQEISDDFLQWLVENPGCEEVEVFYGLFSPTGRQVDPSDLSQNQSSCTWKYKVELDNKREECRTGSLSECVKGIIDKQLVEINNLQQETFESAAELDCPFEFTSRCTIGRCDCKPKQDANEILDNGQSKRRIYSRSEMIEFGKKCAEFGYENSLDNEGQLTDEWINENL